ncbi:MAG: type II secretion system minor pseudopilin GspK [Pseudomonadota bacterium]
MNSKKSQRGIALLTAILILALAVIAATSISANHQLSIKRTENIIFGSQVWSYLHGGEAWSKVILARDLDDDNQYDATSEGWATKIPPLPLPGGYISGQLNDEQAKINVNNLIIGENQNPVTRARIERLFSLLEQDPKIVQAIIDWIDPDVQALPPDGAEDDYYIGLEQPYLAANQTMKHISELRLAKGVTQEVYDIVSPYLTALPENTSINVNTAEAVVLASVVPQLSISSAETIVNEREDEPFESIQEFLSSSSIQGSGVNAQGLSTQSSFFNLESEVKIANSIIRNNSLLQRFNSQNILVISRTPI